MWNANDYCSLVAVFNIQGSAYSRELRRFHTHSERPAALTATVSSADVPVLAGAGELFAAYIDSTRVSGVAWDGDYPAVVFPLAVWTAFLELSVMVHSRVPRRAGQSAPAPC